MLVENIDTAEPDWEFGCPLSCLTYNFPCHRLQMRLPQFSATASNNEETPPPPEFRSNSGGKKNKILRRRWWWWINMCSILIQCTIMANDGWERGARIRSKFNDDIQKMVEDSASIPMRSPSSSDHHQHHVVLAGILLKLNDSGRYRLISIFVIEGY